MTVLHIDTERGWRGGERQTLWLAEALARAGHRSLIAARRDEPLAVRAAAAGLPVIACAPVAEFDPIAVWRLRRAVARAGADIVHAHTAHAIALAALAVARTPARMVLTRRAVFPLKRNAATRWKYRRADAAIAISAAVARALADGGVPEARIEVIHSGIDLRRTISPAPGEMLRALGIDPGRPLVVQVGQLGRDKDPLTFVRAIGVARGRQPSLQALLVGDGPLRAAVEGEIATRGLGDTLRLAGYRTDADRLLAAADVVALSSAQEGLGTVILDAMSLGKPVAATAAGGIPEMIRHEATGLLAPVGDADALGAAIARLVADVDLARRLGTAGRALVEREFSIDRTVEQTVRVYERVLAGR